MKTVFYVLEAFALFFLPNTIGDWDAYGDWYYREVHRLEKKMKEHFRIRSKGFPL